MKICFVNPHGYSIFSNTSKLSKHQSIGGAEVQIYYLATYLAFQPDLDITMLVEEREEKEKEKLQGVTIHFIVPSKKTNLRMREIIPFRSKRYFNKLKEIDADVYIQRGGALLTGDVGLFCKENGKKFIFMTAHLWDCTDRHLVGFFNFGGKYYLEGLKSANLVFSQSQEHIDLLKRYFNIESSIYRAVFPELKLAIIPEEKENNILWIGRCVKWKQPELFFDIANSFPKQTHTMICPPIPGNYKYFELIKEKSQAIPNLNFIEYVPFQEIHLFFNNAFLFINTSIEEGFPNTFIQSTRSGIPILSLNVNPDNMLFKHNIGFSAKGNLDKLKENLKEMINRQDVYHEISSNCKIYFSNYHSYKENALYFYNHIKML